MTDLTSNNHPILVYRASAGSGKTFTLVAHYLSYLLSSPSPTTFAHVLAVTFTNKATAEMKSRILETLYGIAHDLNESESSLKMLTALTQLSEATLKTRAQSALTAILHGYHRFAISTIDAFQKKLVQGIALELGLPAGFQVDIDMEQAIHDAVEQLFAHLQVGSPEFSWIVENINKRLDEDRKWDMRQEVEDFALSNLLNEHVLQNETALLSALQGGKAQSYEKQLFALKTQAKSELTALAKRWDEALSEKGIENKTFSRGSSFATYINRIKTCDSTEPTDFILTRLEDEDAWLTKDSRKDASLRALVPFFMELLGEIEAGRKKWLSQYNSANLTLAHLPSLYLLFSIDRSIRQQREERGHFMLSRIPILIHNLQGNSDASFVFEKAGIRFEHILMDECQDTSQVQWENFKNLFLQNAATGQTDLLVGDAKQSIYRWRGSDYRLLENVKDDADLGKRVNTHTLDSNYRSARTIVEFNNSFFSTMSCELSSTLPEIENIYAEVEQKAHKTNVEGCVNLQLYAPTDDKNVARRAMSDMAQEMLALHEKGLPFGQMIVLTRTNQQLKTFIDFCMEEGLDLPLVSEEAFQLDASVGVLTLMEALRLLTDPNNLVAQTFITYQYERFTNKNISVSLPRAAKKPEAILPLDLKSHREQLLSMPLVELIELLILKFGINEWTGQAPYVHALLDEVMTFATEHMAHAADLVDEWDDHMHTTKIPVTGSDGVRLLTIHKAKGLEAHTVFLPFCDWELAPTRGPKQTFWCEPTEPPYDQLPTVPINKVKAAALSIYKQSYRNELHDESIESINLLYVAFTRAKSNLYIYAPLATLKKNGTDSTVAHVIRRVINQSKPIADDQDFSLQFGTPQTTADEKKAGSNPLRQQVDVCPQSLHIYESTLEFKQSNESFELTQGEAGEQDDPHRYILRGKLLHKIFSSIHTRSEAAQVFEYFRQQSEFCNENLIDEAKRLFRNGMEDERIADWFDERWEVRNESDLLLPANEGYGVRRPDRVLIGHEGQAVVIDFKFATPRPEHGRQVSEYKDLLARMGYADVKGFLWYVYPNKVTEV